MVVLAIAHQLSHLDPRGASEPSLPRLTCPDAPVLSCPAVEVPACPAAPPVPLFETFVVIVVGQSLVVQPAEFQGVAMLARVARVSLPLGALLIKVRFPAGRVPPRLVLVQAPLIPSHSLCFVRGKACTGWPWTTSSCWPAGRQGRRPPLYVEVPSLSSSSLSGLMFQISGVLQVQQRLSQSCCQTVPPQGPTLDGIGKRTQMLASRAWYAVATSALMAPWLLVYACVVSTQKASRPCVLCSFGFETHRRGAASSIGYSRMFEVLTCCTHGHNNPNSFRVESRGCEQPVSVPCGYAVYRDVGTPILKEGRKLAVELKLRKSPLKTPEVPIGGHKGDSEGHGAEDA